ncbi:hypothetical protein BSL78_04468 [Apostichopus japonicus]|uniref:Reverse transcriptase domain-containing protein n=1 Tax=Stichopus japonicus TaxID=307972 RepID=A0A2G8LEH4_STIJA|nr:hypothetical protein BSL78_04468 [Apostichopus japonicus]
MCPGFPECRNDDNADEDQDERSTEEQKEPEEANRLLGNTQHYKLLDSDPTQEITQNVKRVIQKIVSNGSIDRKLGQNLLENYPKPGRFYFLPKIHKESNPGRPIKSGNGTATEKIPKFVDLLIQPLVSALPSYVQDTTDFIRKIGEIKNLPLSSLLVSLDVSSSYTNIPNEEGISACTKAFKPKRGKTPTKKELAELMQLTLTNNNLVFGNKHYLQIHGTAMGTKMYRLLPTSLWETSRKNFYLDKT